MIPVTTSSPCLLFGKRSALLASAQSPHLGRVEEIGENDLSVVGGPVNPVEVQDDGAGGIEIAEGVDPREKGVGELVVGDVAGVALGGPVVCVVSSAAPTAAWGSRKAHRPKRAPDDAQRMSGCNGEGIVVTAVEDDRLAHRVVGGNYEGAEPSHGVDAMGILPDVERDRSLPRARRRHSEAPESRALADLRWA